MAKTHAPCTAQHCAEHTPELPQVVPFLIGHSSTRYTDSMEPNLIDYYPGQNESARRRVMQIVRNYRLGKKL